MAENKAKSKFSAFAGVKAGLSALSDIFRSLFSKDGPTRKGAFFFFVSLSCFLWLLFSELGQLRGHRSAGDPKDAGADAGANLGKVLSREKTQAESRVSTLDLGNFQIELKTVPGKKRAPGSMNMAEVEVVVECDKRETCKFMEDNVTQVRDQISTVLVSLERDELLSIEGKQKVKTVIREKLNSWLPHGRVKKLFFTSMIIS